MTTRCASPSARMTLAAAAVTPTQEDEDEKPILLLGSFQTSIVGIRYYAGTAHPGEYVELVREPGNPYDSNAIRVDNMGNEKVGHIKRQVAVALAPIMDTLATVKVDGTIPYPGNEYTMPCSLELYSEDASDQTRVNIILQQNGIRWKINKDLAASTPANCAVEVFKHAMDWKSANLNLDEMFEALSKDKLSSLPEIEMPTTLHQTLFDHQVQGIRWLHHRETSDEQVPFYKQVKEGGRNVWFSEITNSSQPNAPLPLKGSILADDMGLGKTLQSIGLILANPPKPDMPKTTLIICPVSVMPNWIQEIEHHVQADTLKVALYHGPTRHQLLSELNDLDVMIASYGSIATEYGAEFAKNAEAAKQKPKKKKRKTDAPSIFSQTFHRIILDEAHTIRNTKSRTFAGCSKLRANYRLCLTGTPIQNRPEDLHSLFSFLSVEPLGDRNVFRRAISQPIQNGDSVGLARLRTMMAHVALRRNKQTTKNLELAEKSVELRAIEYPKDSPHKRIHDALFESARVAFRATLSAGDAKALKNYMMILETLTRVRQACVSGRLVPQERFEAAERVLAEVKGMKNALTSQEGEALLQKLKGAFDEVESMECAVCLSEMEETGAVILRSCSHVFCEPCLSKVFTIGGGVCPLCRQKFEPQDMIKKAAAAAAAAALKSGDENKQSTQSINDLGPSPKLDALGQAIAEMKADEKGVIFSQFTKFLNIVEPYLKSLGYTFVRIDGSKTAAQRISAMKEFSAEEGPRFILCSLHAAGTGITLNRANHCFMMDTWWNVSVENQAMDRVHRIGQTRAVRVVRFVMKDTIEERMIALQESKAAMGKGAMEKLKPEEIRKARINDLKSLFSINEPNSVT